MREEYDYYQQTQFLGKHGVTQSCMQAMVAILTSGYRPEKIVAVIGSLDGTPSKRVLFLVWHWFYPGITIISDGFGTHGGEGGAGLATVLGFIKHYQVPLQQVWIYSKDAFDVLAYGKLTEEMFDVAQKATDYDWNFYRPAQIREVQKGRQRFLVALRPQDGHETFQVLLP